MASTGADTGADAPASVRALIAARAAAAPAAPYLISPETGRVVGFGELERRALAVAALLARRGVPPGGRVGLLMPNGVGTAALFLGIMAAGRTAMPISLLARPEQIAYVLRHSGCRLAFVAPELADTLDRARALLAASVAPVAADPDGGDVLPAAADWPETPPGAEDCALLMYTSGTTGRPKGVRLSQRNVLSGARFVGAAHRLGPADRALGALPLYHINAQIVTTLGCLASGGSLVLPRRFSASAFWDQAATFRCTWLNVVPTIIAYLLAGDAAAHAGRDLSALRFCRSASAPLPPEHHRAFEARFGIGVIETMGLTETAAQVFSNPLDPAARRVGSPGRAFGNAARIACPRTAHPLPDGEIGEIQIRGPNVMLGYLDDAEETARAFTADDWLKTGDLGRRDADGFYTVTGRLKELIIKGGENISPREIDEALLRHPAVIEAAAVGVSDSAYGQEIAAGVVVRPGATVDEAELRAFCEDLLGRFKTPRAIRILPELPKGPSGKVQRLKLLDVPAFQSLTGTGGSHDAARHR